jgi:hypothetical protein
VEIRLAVLADYAAVTDDGKLVVAGVFDTLAVAELPAAHAHVAIAVRIHVPVGEGPEHDIAVRFVDPDGQQLLEMGGRLPVRHFDAERGAIAQIVVNLEPLAVQRLGTHAFDIFLDDEYAHTVNLEVVQGPAAEKT